MAVKYKPVAQLVHEEVYVNIAPPQAKQKVTMIADISHTNKKSKKSQVPMYNKKHKGVKRGKLVLPWMGKVMKHGVY